MTAVVFKFGNTKMDTGLPENPSGAFGSFMSQAAVSQASRAGVILDPVPLPRTSAALQTDVSQDLLEQRATQEQARLMERFRLLRQWQQQQQTRLMVQQQQQLELLKNQQDMVQHALMQQRLKQWGGNPATKSPQKTSSPGKSPVSSPSRSAKPVSSLPKALAKASLELSAHQEASQRAIENISSNLDQRRANISQEENGFDSESDHPGSESVDDGVYPLPDTASEASDVDESKHNGCHDNRLRNDSLDHESDIDDEEHLRSVSDQDMTPTKNEPPNIKHLSIHLPDTEDTEDSNLPASPNRYPISPSISPQMSPFSPFSPGHRHQVEDEEQDDIENGDLDNRPIQSQMGSEFKSFEELVELQLKSDKKKPPPAASTTSEQTTSRSQHTFLKKGEGIARFGMKPRKFKARKIQGSDEPKQTKDGGGKKQPGKAGGAQKQTLNKKKAKKDEPPKISRKVSSKQHQTGQETSASEDVFKKPLPVGKQNIAVPGGGQDQKTKLVSSPVEKERIGVPLQLKQPKHHLIVPSRYEKLSDDSPSGHDDTLEASFNRHKKVWEKKAKIEQEDLDEFEMLEQAADDNASFCSEASLVVNVMQRAKKRKQELLGLSPHVKPPQLATLLSVDAAEEQNTKPESQSSDTSPDTSPDVKRKENDIEAQKQSRHMQSEQGIRANMVQRERIADGLFLSGQPLVKGNVAEIRDSFYSSDSDSESEDDVGMKDDGQIIGHGRAIMRKISKRTSPQTNRFEHEVFEPQKEEKGREKKIDNGLRRNSSDSEEEEEDNEDEDFEIFKLKMGKNRNNNNSQQFQFKEMKKNDDEKAPKNNFAGKSTISGHDTMATGSHMSTNGHVTPENLVSDKYGEDFEGTPRKTVAPPESVNGADFEDEETWGDFTANLSDSSDDDSIIAMAPDLQSISPKDDRLKVEMKRKTIEKVTGAEGFPSPPPISDLVARLFPNLRQPQTKQEKEIEQREKVLHSVAQQPSGDGSQARLLRDKLTQLENEIERFRKENLLLAKLREEREKGLNLMKKEMDEFQTQKEEELQRLKEYKEEETKKLKKERKLFEKHQKTLRTMPDKRDRAEIDMLKNQLSELQAEMKERESRWNASTKRLRDRTVALESENAELREEIRLLEQRRLASWKKEEDSMKHAPKRQHSVPRPRPPALPTNLKAEHSNNNNINRMRPGSEDKVPFPEVEKENHYYAMNKRRTNSESSDSHEYLHTFPHPNEVEKSKKEEEKIYESRILQPRRSRSPSDRERLSIPTPSEQTPSPLRTKPSSLSPSLPSSDQNTPLSGSPLHQPRGSPQRIAKAGLNHGSPERGVSQSVQNGGNGDYEELVHNDGKVELVNQDGSRVINFSNGTRKEISADGRTITISFFNGDMKQIMPDQRVVYYYSETKTTHTTYTDGLEILQFSNNQTEKHYPDGTKEITFPDQTIKYLYPNGGEESVFADGTVLRVEPNGRRIMEFPNGQREIHTEQYKKREYPDGTVKTVYPDGRQETRYSSGRLRIKDSAGKIIMDKKC